MIEELSPEAKQSLIDAIKGNTLTAFRYYVFTTYSYDEYFIEAAFIYYAKAAEYCLAYNDFKKYIIIDIQEDEHKRID